MIRENEWRINFFVAILQRERVMGTLVTGKSMGVVGLPIDGLGVRYLVLVQAWFIRINGFICLAIQL